MMASRIYTYIISIPGRRVIGGYPHFQTDLVTMNTEDNQPGIIIPRCKSPPLSASFLQEQFCINCYLLVLRIGRLRHVRKILLLVIGLVVIVAINKQGAFSGVSYERPGVLVHERPGKGIKNIQFSTLFEAEKPLSSLAKPNYYTVVEGYLDSCAICKRLEAGFPAFLNQRRDVVIRRVHFPEGGMNVSFSGNDRASVEQQVESYNRRIESYNFCSTPHIEIYDPAGQVIVADSCTKKPATEFLQQWMAQE